MSKTTLIQSLRHVASLAAVVVGITLLFARVGFGADPPDGAAPIASPLTPEASLAAIQISSELRIELVAAEPEVIDPVAIRFDEDGRLWVVEMRDYPNGPADGEPPASQVKWLEDRDGDGRYETAHVFADHLLFANGLQPWRGGVIVTQSGRIDYLRDTDGDGRADAVETWFTGFAEENPQLRVNHPRFALDNFVHVANGLRGGTVVSLRQPQLEPVDIRGRDLRFDPLTGRCEAFSGNGQFGLSFDDFGNKFICSNRNPGMHVVLLDAYLRHNPDLAVPAVVQDVAASGEASRVYPMIEAWTTSILHAGQFTAACGVEVYRGDALPPEYRGNLFTCEPTGSLVHREIVEPDGASFRGHAATEGVEFLASRDPWFKAVNLETGPDGALYVVDMHRAVIEHPQFMPVELKERPDLRYGDDRGRIYRVLAADAPRESEKPWLSGATGDELVKRFKSQNSWWRETAARLIYERRDKAFVAPLVAMARDGAEATARVHALRALSGLDALDRATLLTALRDQDPRVREQAVVLAEPLLSRSAALRANVLALADDPDARLRFQVALSLGACDDPQKIGALARIALRGADDRWTRAAVETAVPGQASTALIQVLALLDERDDRARLAAGPLVEELAVLTGSGRSPAAAAELLRAVGPWLNASGGAPIALTAIKGLARGMRSRGTNFAQFLATGDGDDAAEARDVAKRAFAMAETLSVSDDVDPTERLAAIEILGYADQATAAGPLSALIRSKAPTELRREAVAALAAHRVPAVGQFLIDSLTEQTPAMRSAILDALLSNPGWCGLLLDEIEAERLRPAELGTPRIDRLVKHRDAALADRAKRLLAAELPADRVRVTAEYQAALTLDSDARRGKELFRKNCGTCHKIGDVGVDVGPSIADSRNKKPEQLLVDILQPSRAIDNNFVSYSITTTDGNAYTGIIVAETATSLTIKMAEAKTVSLLRADLDEIRSNGVSLMPEGLERSLSVQDVADVIAFVKNWRYLDTGVPAATGK